jgi:hypothetical protein
MKSFPFQPRNSFFHSRRRRLGSISTVALTDKNPTEDAESTKKRRSRFTRNLRDGYRKQVWRVVGILGIVIAVGIFCCFHHSQEWNWKFLYLDDPLAVLYSTISSTANQSANEYEWDWSTKDQTVIPYISSRRKSIFTALTKQDKDKLKRMKEDFEKLKSTGMLLPCRIDEGENCYREIKPSVAEYYFTKFLRSSTTTGTGGRRMLLHNPLPEGMTCR